MDQPNSLNSSNSSTSPSSPNTNASPSPPVSPSPLHPTRLKYRRADSLVTLTDYISKVFTQNIFFFLSFPS